MKMYDFSRPSAAWAATEPAVPPPPTPASWELEWEAPSGCPDAAAIREQVAALGCFL